MMKLRKALEKATQQSPAAKTAAEVKPIRQPQPVAESHSGWVSPSYTVSQTVELDSRKARRNRCAALFADSPALTDFKILREKIQLRTQAQALNLIMVTSAMPREGKTLTTINLGVSFAMEYDQTALLVDCDLKKQQISEYMGYRHDRGLVDNLLDGLPLKDLIVWPQVEKLTVISGGRSISNSAEMLSSPKMRNLIREMKMRYDDRYIFFDVPSVLNNADAISFAPLVDCIVMVVATGRTSTKDIQKAVEMLPRDKIIGFVLNRHGGEVRV